MCQHCADVVKVVQAIQLVEGAKKRRPEPQRPEVTYFSIWDEWVYQARMDTRVCPICTGFEDTYMFRGNHLRATFPELEIMDYLTIQVNAHPNCRCELVRKTD